MFFIWRPIGLQGVLWRLLQQLFKAVYSSLHRFSNIKALTLAMNIHEKSVSKCFIESCCLCCHVAILREVVLNEA